MKNRIRRDIDRDYALNRQEKKSVVSQEKASRVFWCDRCGAPVCDTAAAREAHNDTHQARDDREARMRGL